MVNLTEVEKFYIEAHRNLKPHKISRNMRKSVTELVVDEYLLALPPEEQQKTTVSDLMSRKADKGAVVMTEQASEKSDDSRDRTNDKEATSQRMERINDRRIHRMR